jgi:hypothetical protein
MDGEQESRKKRDRPEGGDAVGLFPLCDAAGEEKDEEGVGGVQGDVDQMKTEQPPPRPSSSPGR